MRDVCLVSLSGQGDHIAFLVNPDVHAWIVRKDTPGRRGRETSWIDTEAPSDVIEGMRADASREAEDMVVMVTSGSYQNDRALFAQDAALAGGSFDSDERATECASANGMNVVDEYHGMIY